MLNLFDWNKKNNINILNLYLNFLWEIKRTSQKLNAKDAMKWGIGLINVQIHQLITIDLLGQCNTSWLKLISKFK